MKKIFLFLKLWLPVGLWCGAIFYLSSLPSLATPWGAWDIVLRKIAHITEYGILAFLVWRAIFHSVKINLTRTYAYSGALSLLYAISDEIHQSFVPTRNGSVFDVLIDALGIGLMLYFLMVRKKNVNR
ncbi:MAG: VanZ family protein [Elusimicrobiota bacterium]|nr:VanZ family protein [Elusimicrobiota bacterium]MDH5661499.1 VanZ family protein [Elusimicrobiota bacterium]